MQTLMLKCIALILGSRHFAKHVDRHDSIQHGLTMTLMQYLVVRRGDGKHVSMEVNLVFGRGIFNSW